MRFNANFILNKVCLHKNILREKIGEKVNFKYKGGLMRPVAAL